MPIEVENIDQYKVIRLTGRRGDAINTDFVAAWFHTDSLHLRKLVISRLKKR